jgi:hypothetical protein
MLSKGKRLWPQDHWRRGLLNSKFKAETFPCRTVLVINRMIEKWAA